MRFLSLFTGIGGLDLGLERAGWEPVAFCEQDRYCRAVLARRWPGVPCFEDVRTLDPSGLGGIDAVVGGFPCQDISAAGKGAGLAGEKSGLWWEMHRVIDAVRPRWIVAENVPALRTRGADQVLESLEGIGYACWPIVVGADDVGAPHRRKRVFIIGRLADGGGSGSQGHPGHGDNRARRAGPAGPASAGGDVLADTPDDLGRPGIGGPEEGAGPRELGRRGHSGGGDGLADAERQQGDPSRGHDIQRGRPGDAEQAGLGHRGFPPRPDDYTGWARVLAVRPDLAPAQAEPGICRVADGIPTRMARRHWRAQLRAFGNAVCPHVAQVIGEGINRTEAALARDD